jgi:hypothetical protein
MKFISNERMKHNKGEKTMMSNVIETQKKEQKADENFIAIELIKESWYLPRS